MVTRGEPEAASHGPDWRLHGLAESGAGWGAESVIERGHTHLWLGQATPMLQLELGPSGRAGLAAHIWRPKRLGEFQRGRNCFLARRDSNVGGQKLGRAQEHNA